MRKTLLQLFVAAFLLLSIGTIQAQDTNAKLPGSITLKGLMVNYDTPFRGTYTDYRNTTPGVELGYIHPINEYFNLGIPLKFGIGRFTDDTEVGSGTEQLFGALDAILQFHVFGSENVFSPYILAGTGATLESRGANKSSNLHVDIPLGLGLNIRLFENGFW